MKSRSLRRAGSLLLALALAFSLLTLPASADDPVLINSITLPNAVELESGGITAINASVTPGNATNINDIRWAASGSNKITVSGSGLSASVSVAGDAIGGEEAEITASAGNVSATCTVRVKVAQPDSPNPPDPPAPTVRITVSPDTASVPAVDSIRLTATVTPESAASGGVEWSCKENGIKLSSLTGTETTVTVSEGYKGSNPFNVEAKVTDTAASTVCVIQVSEPQTPAVREVLFTSPNTDAYRYLDPGAALTLEAAAYPLDAALEDRQLVWTSSNKDAATVNSRGEITGVAPGRTTIRAAAAGDETKYAEREIEVSGLLLSYVKKSTSGGRGETIQLTENSTVDIFQYRDIQVLTEALGNARNQVINWESSNNTVAQVINGRVTANYPGTGAVITAAVAGTGFSSSFKVNVSEDVAQAITVNMGSDPSYSFSGLLSQLNSRSQDKAGGPLDCVYNLKVSTENGVLYYKYASSESPGHGVGGTDRYYYQASQGQMALRDVTFVPLPGFDGTAVVDYNAVSTNGTTFTGTIRIEATATGDVNYSTTVDQPVDFAAEHFSDVCRGRTGQAIRYITFGLPSSSRGTLYYNYSPTGQYSPKVNNSTRYYVTSSPSIDDITFVPAEGYVGDVDVPYLCTDSTGATYSGTVRIRVYGANGEGSSNVEYSTGRNQRKSLNGSDFNNACQRAANGTLNYIRFTSLPSSSAGILYYNYTSSSSSRVSTGTDYRRSGSPSISNVTFVPAGSYTGTVSIPFTGYDEDSVRFNGTVTISVGGGSGQIISYTAATNGFVRFSASDFNSACRSATGDTLSYVRFDLPSSQYGTLYHQYNSASRTGNAVSSSTGYYYSNNSRLLGDVSFAASSASGTVTFGYTGYSTRGDSFTGTVEVTVSGSSVSGSSVSSSVIRYTGSAAHPISFRGTDFQNACQAALGNPLSYVRFNTLPYTGHLYQNYSSPARTGTDVNSVTHYSAAQLSQISYLPKAEYQGTLTIPYAAYDTQGGSHSGTVELQLSNAYCSATFSDAASGWDWAKPSIEFLRSSGITNGYSNNTYRPGQSISRGEFTLMICRAFQFPTDGVSSFPDVPANSTYAGAVATARNLGIVQGNNGRFQPDQPITRQSAMTMICRAIEAAGQTLPAADTALLSSYADGSQVSVFARPSVAALVQMGAVRGNSSSRLNPGAAISRAEMAVILHRVLTR